MLLLLQVQRDIKTKLTVLYEESNFCLSQRKIVTNCGSHVLARENILSPLLLVMRKANLLCAAFAAVGKLPPSSSIIALTVRFSFLLRRQEHGEGIGLNQHGVDGEDLFILHLKVTKLYVKSRNKVHSTLIVFREFSVGRQRAPYFVDLIYGFTLSKGACTMFQMVLVC